MKKFLIFIIFVLILFFAFLFFFSNGDLLNNEYEITPEELSEEESRSEEVREKEVKEVKEEEKENSFKYPPIEKLETPKEVRAIYLTAYSATNENKIDSVIGMAKRGEINSVIIDVNGYSGYISYDSNLPETEEYNIEDVKIRDIRGLIEKLKEENIYTIARITVFQDSAFASERPDLAIKTKSTGLLWIDNGDQAWLDPASQEVWDYKLSLAKEVSNIGFDELNFDYIRFPSDGDLRDIDYPFWDEKKLRHEVIRDFFAFLRENLPNEVLSADLFGLVTINNGDLGIGQVIEDAFPYFDFISPMVYPSHYADGFMNYQNPAEQPYGVVYFSMWKALNKLEVYKQNNPESREVKLRPWLQDFNLGANYNEFMVKVQIQATQDALGDNYVGFMMWDPSNIYTSGAFRVD